MLRHLRVLLIATATVATVLVGLREVLADARGVGCAVRCLVDYEGSREDDSGTVVEQAEGDDIEEELEQELPLHASTSPRCSLVSTISAAVPQAVCPIPESRGGVIRSRGPPAAL